MNNTTEAKRAPWRATETILRGQHIYKVESGSEVWTVIHCSHTTTRPSPGTLSTFQQIVREHNERTGLIDALQKIAVGTSPASVALQYSNVEALCAELHNIASAAIRQATGATI